MEGKKRLKEVKKMIAILVVFISFITLAAAQDNDYTYTNNWYVGDTEAGEWIKHKKIRIAKGDYRFTVRAIAPEAGKTLALALNEEIVFSGVEVPNDKEGRFQLMHLGSKQIEEGYYDIKLIFETGDVNCDMIFIKKDDRTDAVVLSTDIDYSLNHNDGMHISPIAGASGSSSVLAKYGDPGDNIAYYFQADPGNGLRYTREQVMQWNKQYIYTYHHEYTQEAMDLLVQEFAESKVDFIWAHGRGEPDNRNEIIDRDFRNGAGGMPCRGLSVLVDAIKRNPYSKNNLKIAYFFDSAASFTSGGLSQFYSGSLDYRKDDFRNFMWEFAIKKWYSTIPEELLYLLPDHTNKNRKIVPMQWWTAGLNTRWGDKTLIGGEGIPGFLKFLEQKMMEEFGLTVAWVLDNSFFDGGGDIVRNMAWGTQGWFIWGQNITEMKTFGDKKFAFALNGGRTPIYESVRPDWNPYTEEGTFVGDSRKIATKGYHVNALDESGEPVIREIYERGTDENAEWLVLESWFDWYEGSTWYRSDHREYAYPNQHLNLCREFSDKETTSILLEAESCDEFYDKSKGNSGGAYRLDWYKESEFSKDYIDANLEIDLDIFRPLHQLSAIEAHAGRTPSTVNKIEAGLKDVWMLTGKNNSIYCNELDGYPVTQWNAASSNNYLKDLTLGGFSAWGITPTGVVVRSSLPEGQASNQNSSWQVVNGDMTMVDLDANDAMIWSVDDNANIYYRNFSASKPWVKVDGQLTSIAVDELFGWGFDPDGSLKRFDLQNRTNWKTIPNPHQLIHLSVNCGEVWGVNAQNEVYRMSSSGYGSWEFVATGYKDVSVGTNFVWFLDVDGKPHKCKLTSFVDRSVFVSQNYTDIQNPFVSTTSVSAFPNPFVHLLNVKISSPVEESINLTVTRIDGQVVFATTATTSIGISEVELGSQLSNLQSGIYLLNIDKKSGREVLKIVKK